MYYVFNANEGVKEADCTFQFNKDFSENILRGRIDNASVALLKSVSILLERSMST